MADPLVVLNVLMYAACSAGALFLGAYLFRRWLDRIDAPVNGWACMACFGVAGVAFRIAMMKYAWAVADAHLLEAANNPVPDLVFGTFVLVGMMMFTIRIRKHAVVLMRRMTAKETKDLAAAKRKQDEVLTRSPIL